MASLGQMATATERPQISTLKEGREVSLGPPIVLTISPSSPTFANRSAAGASHYSNNMSTQTASAGAGDPMDVAASSPNNGHSPGASHSADTDNDNKSNDRSKNSSPHDQGSGSSSVNMPAPPPAAAAIHQPKIVQTAFIHKLYNMLEDDNIRHLISWSASADSFVMSPSPDFSKVLSQYFKHTNISSFVRQLNMYGFHKERDVFHTGNPESTLWEFKHGGGNFKRGDIAGLREIKRRASRHALVHRETNYPKPASSQPGTPAEPIHLPPENPDTRMTGLDSYDLSVRLQRSEDTVQHLHYKSRMALDSMSQLLQVNQDLSRILLNVVGPENPAHRDILTLQGDLARQADRIRSLDEPYEPPMSSGRQYFGGLDNAPVSPRQLPQDDSRRQTLAVPRGHNLYRPPVPSNLSISTRRPYGSIGGGTTTTHSSPSRHPPPPPPLGPHPMTNVEPPPGSLARRHTSADIRAHGWPPGSSSLAESSTPANYPSSPSRLAPEDQRIRESFSNYSLQQASQNRPSSRPTTPPPPFSNGGVNTNGTDTFGGWNWGSAVNRTYKESSAPPTRRGSVAHILNPSDTAERSDEDERGEEDRKRKRLL